MVNFGFKTQNDRQIVFEDNDRTLFHYIKRTEPSISLCIACGGCTATCSAGAFTDFSLRKIFLYIRRGENVMVAKQVQKCMLCGKCTLVCPKGVNTRHAILLIKEFLQKTEK